MWGLFTCGPEANLPAFADNFARVSFKVQIVLAIFKTFEISDKVVPF